eukprot:4896598-Pyramimonas_sp.AAC.1
MQPLQQGTRGRMEERDQGEGGAWSTRERERAAEGARSRKHLVEADGLIGRVDATRRVGKAGPGGQ